MVANVMETNGNNGGEEHGGGGGVTNSFGGGGGGGSNNFISAARQSPKIAASPGCAAVAAAAATTTSSSIGPASLSVVSSMMMLRSTGSPAGMLTTRKIMSRNQNNTLFPTSFPANLAELQLFRVMQNASLLFYYDTLLEMGGDDVQQLCDAGEEEFLEIMSLVGMASKPLHVRRFQKSLQEWVTHAGKFKAPLIVGDDFELVPAPAPPQPSQPPTTTPTPTTTVITTPPANPPASSVYEVYSSSPASPKRSYSPLDCPPSSSSSPGSNASSSATTPALLDTHIAKLAAAAERLSRELPQCEPKAPPSSRKRMCKELELVMSMPEGDARRMEEIRRYAAIYGRFDCKRRPEKPLTLHEVSVNEAAAQICRFIPALLTRRDELFPLARRVVKAADCHFSKTGVGYSPMCLRTSQSDLIDALANSNSNHSNHSGSGMMRRLSSASQQSQQQQQQPQQLERSNGDDGVSSSKRARYDDEQDCKHGGGVSLLHQRQQHNRICMEDMDNGVHYAMSDSNSPLPEERVDTILEEDDDDEEEEEDDLEDDVEDEEDADGGARVRVIAARGDDIIAVANPALALSPTIIPLPVEPHLTD